jgi:hypothetical protein
MTDEQTIDVMSSDDVPMEVTDAALPDLAQSEMDLLRSRFKLAEQIARTDFVPDYLKGNPAAILACFMTGRELGLGPMASLQHISIINGRPFLSAELQAAKVRAAGHSLEGSATATEATITGTRKDTGDTISVTWTLQTALDAGLIDEIKDGRAVARSKLGRPLPWESYPQAMLWARAMSQLCGMLFSDVIVVPGSGE